MRFAIIGTGGVGGFFGSKLSKSGVDVWFLARGKHLDAMCENGLQVNSFEGNWTIPPGKFASKPDDIGIVDVVLFCVKSYDTESAAKELTPLLSDTTIIISLQNGVDNEEKIRKVIPRGIVFGGVAYIYSTITAPGVITHTVGPTKIVFGELQKPDDATTRKSNEILEAMIHANINATRADDIRSEMWKKYVFIAAVGGMTALTRATLGEILAAKASRDMLADAMRETETIARAKGVNLPPNFTEHIFEVLKQYDNNSRSSMYHDLMRNKPLEIEAFSGTIVNYGLQLGIPTPAHKAIYAGLLPAHLKNSKGNP
jgi:2-dehydropantoate 2-reductase